MGQGGQVGVSGVISVSVGATRRGHVGFEKFVLELGLDLDMGSTHRIA